MQALESGGGGRKNAAMQALATAQLAARKAANASAEASGREGGGPDPRLQPPDRAERVAQFKPGTSTWNTDDPSQVGPGTQPVRSHPASWPRTPGAPVHQSRSFGSGL